VASCFFLGKDSSFKIAFIDSEIEGLALALGLKLSSTRVAAWSVLHAESALKLTDLKTSGSRMET
jgi:urea transporter